MITDALKLIIAKSPDAMLEAIKCLQAISAKSPVVQQRYNHVVEIALTDLKANFTPDERAVLADSLAVFESDTRGFTLKVRLTESERGSLQTQADEVGMTMSEFVRRKIF